MRLLGSLACSLAVAVPLLVFLLPVRTSWGPGWVGHVHLSFEGVAFVPIGATAGRSVDLVFLGIECGLAALIGLGAWLAGAGKGPSIGRGTL